MKSEHNQYQSDLTVTKEITKSPIDNTAKASTWQAIEEEIVQGHIPKRIMSPCEGVLELLV
jgi:hypothetical protein